MATNQPRPSLIAIVGPTASGKSELGLQVAKLYNGEIIAADSRTVYRGLDIGTAKPTLKDQQEVPHWGLDMIELGSKFSAAQYKKFARAKIKDIQKRGKLPVLVGGSGLYIDSVLYNYRFTVNSSTNPLNPRHRLKGSYAADFEIMAGLGLFGLLPSDEELRKNISKRTRKMFAKGVVNETKELMLKYGKDALYRDGGIIYKVCVDYILGHIDLGEAKEIAARREWQYARRQKTWFKRNSHILWFKHVSEAAVAAERFLNT